MVISLSVGVYEAPEILGSFEAQDILGSAFGGSTISYAS
jgi:hypothetical protein